MKRLRTWVAGTMTLALTLGGGIWAHHYANAETTGDKSQPQAQAQEQNGKHDKRGAAPGQWKDAPGGKFGFGDKKTSFGFRFAVSDELATLLGMTKDELGQAIKSGKTIAAIAGEKQVDVASVTSLLVKAPLEKLDQQLKDGKLTQEQYDKAKTTLTDSATKFVNGEMGGKPGLPGAKFDFTDKMGGGPHFAFRFAASDELATLLGMTKDELGQAIKSEKSLASIASEKNIDVASVVSLLVKAPLEKLDQQLKDGKLTQEQYDKAKTALTESATKFVNGEMGGKLGIPGDKPGMGDKKLHMTSHIAFRFAVSDELATLLGMTKDELGQALKSGKSLATIAGEKNIDVASVISLLVKAPLEKLDQQLKDGKLTQEQYDKAKTTLTESATKFVNGEMVGKPGLPFGHRGAEGKDGAQRGKVAPGSKDTVDNAANGTKADFRKDNRGLGTSGSSAKTISS